MKSKIRSLLAVAVGCLLLGGCEGSSKQASSSGEGSDQAGTPAESVPFAGLAMKASTTCNRSLLTDKNVLGCFKPNQEKDRNATVAIIPTATGAAAGKGGSDAAAGGAAQAQKEKVVKSGGDFLVLTGDSKKARLIVWSNIDKDWNVLWNGLLGEVSGNGVNMEFENQQALEAKDEALKAFRNAHFSPPEPCPPGMVGAGRFMPEQGFDCFGTDADGKVAQCKGSPTAKGGWLTLCVQEGSQTGLYIRSIKDEGDNGSSTNECPGGTKAVGHFQPEALKGENAAFPEKTFYFCNLDDLTDALSHWDPRYVKGKRPDPCPTAVVENTAFHNGWISVCDQVVEGGTTMDEACRDTQASCSTQCTEAGKTCYRVLGDMVNGVQQPAKWCCSNMAQ